MSQTHALASGKVVQRVREKSIDGRIFYFKSHHLPTRRLERKWWPFRSTKKKTKEKTGTDLKKQIDQHQHYLVAFTLGHRLFTSETSVKNEKKDKSWQNRKRAGLWFSLLGSDMVTRHQIETRPNESSVNKRDVTKSKQTLRERWIPFFFWNSRLDKMKWLVALAKGHRFVIELFISGRIVPVVHFALSFDALPNVWWPRQRISSNECHELLDVLIGRVQIAR